MCVTRNDTCSGCLIWVTPAASRRSLFVLIHISTTTRIAPPSCTLRVGSGCACANTLACRRVCPAHVPSAAPTPFPQRTRFRAGAASSGANLCAWIRVASAAVRPVARARRVARAVGPGGGLCRHLHCCMLRPSVVPFLAPCGSSRLSCLRLLVVRASLLCVEMSRVNGGSNVRHGVCGGDGA